MHAHEDDGYGLPREGGRALNTPSLGADCAKGGGANKKLAEVSFGSVELMLPHDAYPSPQGDIWGWGKEASIENS